jgi:hypothetical protein
LYISALGQIRRICICNLEKKVKIKKEETKEARWLINKVAKGTPSKLYKKINFLFVYQLIRFFRNVETRNVRIRSNTK